MNLVQKIIFLDLDAYPNLRFAQLIFAKLKHTIYWLFYTQEFTTLEILFQMNIFLPNHVQKACSLSVSNMFSIHLRRSSRTTRAGTCIRITKTSSRRKWFAPATKKAVAMLVSAIRAVLSLAKSKRTAHGCFMASLLGESAAGIPFIQAFMRELQRL